MKRAVPAILLMIAGSASAAANEGILPMTQPDRFAQAGRSEPLPLPRDPDIAVREEFELARKRDSAEAWELFIARHKDHALAAAARKELEKLQPRAR